MPTFTTYMGGDPLLTIQTPDPGTLLEQLGALPVAERAERLIAVGEVEPQLLALGDEAERLVVVEVARAKAAARLVVELTDKLGSAKSRARARRALAQAHSYSGEFADAIRLCREAITIAEADDELVQAARARLGLIHAYAETGAYEKAIEAGEEARQMLMNAGEPALAARADLNLGVTHHNHDQPAKALEHFDRARPLLVNEPIVLAQLDSNRGEALMALDDFRGAEAAFESARATFDAKGLGWAVAIVEGNLADLAARRGALDRALYHFERARRSVEKDESSAHLARLLAEQGEARLMLGMTQEALRDFEQALPALEANNQQAESARARGGIGRALLKLGRFDEADAALSEASIAHASLGQDIAQSRIDLVRAAAAIEQARWDDASALLDQTEPRLAPKTLDSAVARFHRASMLFRCSQPEEARRMLDEAIATAQELNIAPLLADLLLLRGRALESEGQRADAIASYRSAVLQIERVRGALQADRFRAAFLGNRLEAYERLAAALLEEDRNGHLEEAFQAVEMAKSRTLLDLVQGVIDLTESVDDEETDETTRGLLGELDQTRSRLNALYRRAGLETWTSDPEWQREVRSLEDQLAGVEERLAATRGVASLFAAPPDVARVQRALGEKTALVEFVVTATEVFAFVVRRDRLRAFRHLNSRRELIEQVRRIQFQLSRALRPGALDGPRHDRLLADINRELDAIGTTLFGPLREAIDDAERLIIVPHGPLHALPFSAVRLDDASLIERCEVVHAPSASLVAFQAEQPRHAPPAQSLVLGVPDAFAPEVEVEAKVIASTVPNATLLVGEAATTDRLIEEAPHARLLHLACHGRFDPASPLSSGLRLADRWLTVRDIYQLKLRAELVTLSACETGLSAISSGDEQTGLLRGLLAAGARSVIVSLWRVSDEVTVDFMRLFYNSCYDEDLTNRAFPTQQQSRLAPLRRAQLETMRTHAHPVFWAPFVMVGGAS